MTAAAQRNLDAIKLAILAQKATAGVSNSVPLGVQERRDMEAVILPGAKDTLSMEASLFANIPKGEVRMPQAVQQSTQRVMPNTAIPIVRTTQAPIPNGVSSVADEPVSPQKSENAGALRATKGSLLQRIKDLRDSVKDASTPFELKPGLQDKLTAKEAGRLAAVEDNPAGGAKC